MYFVNNIPRIVLYTLLAIFSIIINFYYADKGLYPIDTFSFFDTAYYVTLGQLPIRDFWIISGLLIDYIQAFFFLIFGFSWRSYVMHSSFFNMGIALFFFYFLNNFSRFYFSNFLLSCCVAALCYPLIGTPFSYQHSFILSFISILLFYLALQKNDQKYWFFLPFFMLASFLCMQLPSCLINAFILIFLIIYFFQERKISVYFFLGCFLCTLIVFIYFVFTKTNLKDFLVQYIYFPLSFGGERIAGSNSSFESARLLNNFNFKNIILHFKFINLFLLGNILILIYFLKKNFNKPQILEGKKISIYLNIFLFFCGISFIFHQLITANQTFIFSLVPLFCGLLIIQISQFLKHEFKPIYRFILVTLTLFVTLKYHFEYNEKRKFIDLQNVNLSKSIPSKILSEELGNLNWITPYYSENPTYEIEKLQEAIEIIKKDKSNKMLITHYSFISTTLREDLNIPNRWYYPNNTYPGSYENKYYKNYIEKFDKKIKSNNIETIFVVESFPKEFQFLYFQDLILNGCFEKKQLNDLIFSVTLNRKCS